MITELEIEKAAKKNIVIEYSDDDIIIVDNIKNLKGERAKRIPINILLLCTNGNMQADINNNSITLSKNEMLIISPNMFLDNTVASDDFECKVMCLTNKIIHSFLRPHISIWNQVLYSNKLRVRKVKIHDNNIYVKFYELLTILKQMEDNKYKSLIIRSLIKGGILSLCGYLENNIYQNGKFGSQGETIFRKFLDLLDNSKTKRQTVEYYANKLFITPKYLSVICKEKSNKTAIQWIQEYVNEDVRYYLKHTDLSIKEISDILGFPNASFFGRYVKQHFGVSPKIYRIKTS